MARIRTQQTKIKMNKLNYSNIKTFKKLAKQLNNRMLVRRSILSTAKKKKKRKKKACPN